MPGNLSSPAQCKKYFPGASQPLEELLFASLPANRQHLAGNMWAFNYHGPNLGRAAASRERILAGSFPGSHSISHPPGSGLKPPQSCVFDFLSVSPGGWGECTWQIKYDSQRKKNQWDVKHVPRRMFTDPAPPDSGRGAISLSSQRRGQRQLLKCCVFSFRLWCKDQQYPRALEMQTFRPCPKSAVFESLSKNSFRSIDLWDTHKEPIPSPIPK